MAPVSVVVLEGDETGQELLEQSPARARRRAAGPGAGAERFDLSLENRRATSNEVVNEAARGDARGRPGAEGGDDHPEGAGDVGSPNRILREEVDGKVIVRTGRRLPGVAPIAGVHHPISVVRMAVEDAYGAAERREGDAGAADEVAYRTEKITRSTCRAVAEYAFRTAAKMGARVYGGPKWTVSPVYEGMLKEEMDAAAARHPEIPYQPVLIDATYAGLLSGATDAPLVIPALNRDGDCLSDLVLPMFGSIAGAESVLLAFDEDYDTTVRDGRGAPRHRAGPAGQGPGQPAGDDPRLRGAAAPRRRPPRGRLRAGLARHLRGHAGDGRRRAPRRPTWAAMPAPPSSPRRSWTGSPPSSTSGPRWAPDPRGCWAPAGPCKTACRPVGGNWFRPRPTVLLRTYVPGFRQAIPRPRDAVRRRPRRSRATGRTAPSPPPGPDPARPSTRHGERRGPRTASAPCPSGLGRSAVSGTGSVSRAR